MAERAFLDLARVRASGRRALLATVVRGVGPTYRRPGSSAVICEDGEVIGAISGGCLESDVLEAAARVFAGGPPLLLDYDTTGPDDLIWGTGSGCGGRVQILVAGVADELLREVVDHLCTGRSHVVTTVIEPGPALGQRMVGAPDSPEELCWYSEGESLFHQRIHPPTTLLICGAGDDCRPVASLATSVGCRVIVVDHRKAWATPERFPGAEQVEVCEPGELLRRVDLWPGSYAVILSHQFARDKEYLQVLLRQPLAYVGLLGSRQRSSHLLAELLAESPELAPLVAERLRAPVGLDVGADGPQEIAAAIIAELLAHRSGRSGRPLACLGETVPESA